MNTKVRLVRCPKCRNVLPEPPDVPVYKCGGCGTVLQAKKRKNDSDDQVTNSSSNQESPVNSIGAPDRNRMDGDHDVATKLENGTVDAPSNGVEEYSSGKRKMEQLSDDQEAGSSSNQESLVNPTDEPDRNGDHNNLRSSTEISGHEDTKSLPGARNDNRINQDEDATKMQGGLEEYPSNKWKMKQLSDDQEACSSSNQQSMVNLINEPDQNTDHNDPRSSTELSGHEDPQSSPEVIAHNRMDHDQDQDQDRDEDEDHSSGKLKMEQLSDDQEAGRRLNQRTLVASINEPVRNGDNNYPRSSTELSGHEDPESSPEAVAHNREHRDQDHQDEDEDHSSGKLKKKQLSDDQEAGSRLNQRSLVASINEPVRNSGHYEPHCSSELSYHGSSPEAAVHNRVDQDQDQDHHHDYDQVMFAINGDLGDHKIGDEFEESSSFSELNEIEDPSREAIANMKIVRDSDGGSKSSFKSLIAEKLLDTRQRKVVYLDDDDAISEDGSADLCHRRRFERVSSTETLENVGGTGYYGYEGSVSSFDGNNNQIPRKNHIGHKGDEHVDSRNSHHYKRRNGRWGKDVHRSMDVRSFYGDTNDFHENPRHRSSVIPENPKMERLELLKMVRELQDQLERTNVSNAAPHIPSYHNHVPNHPGRYVQRMAFSGEATAVNRRRDGGSCYHCCPQDRHFSAQLPRQCVYCNGPQYVATTCYSSHCSGPSSPQHHSESEFLAPVRSKPEPDDHWQRNDVRKQYRSLKKRYIRPIAGGSPWITCYRCSELLELPQSFLVFKRRCHSVRCGGCMKVLNLTLSNGTHVSRYYPEETIAAPPSSEVEEYANSRAGPVSCSDRSFQKSYSTETDRNGSREFIERRKAVLSRDPSNSAGPSSSKISGRRRNTTSEIEEVEPAAGGSPLHWLMGYASPSKVIRG